MAPVSAVGKPGGCCVLCLVVLGWDDRSTLSAHSPPPKTVCRAAEGRPWPEATDYLPGVNYVGARLPNRRRTA